MAIGNKYGNDLYGSLAGCESLVCIEYIYYVYIHNMFFVGYGGGGVDLARWYMGQIWFGMVVEFVSPAVQIFR